MSANNTIAFGLIVISVTGLICSCFAPASSVMALITVASGAAGSLGGALTMVNKPAAIPMNGNGNGK